MIKLQAINSILDRNNLDEYIRAGINDDYFRGYQEEYSFILDHYNAYDKVPDLATFTTNYPNFEFIEVFEPTSYIIEALKEEYVYDCTVELFHTASRRVDDNSYEGLRYLLREGEKLLQTGLNGQGVDISKIVEEKIEDIKSKQGTEGLLGISSGMAELDKILGGWLPGEELVTIVGRINQGKSWLLQKFLTEAHKQGKTVLHYSGEMGVLQVAYRDDTLGLNYSNRQLMRGTITPAELKKYEEELKTKSETSNPYIVVTPKDFGGRMMDISTLKSLIKSIKPDIVGIDQLSLMEDERKGETNRIKYTHIAQDLFNISSEFGIPVICDAQANRNKSNEENPENPELADIGESDGVGQNSSRVISLVQTKLGLSLYVAKNRYGENKQKLIYSWDIDCGIFRYITEEQNTQSPNVTGLQPRNSTPRERDVTDVF